MKLHGISYLNLQDVSCCFSSSYTKGGFWVTVTIVKKRFSLALIPTGRPRVCGGTGSLKPPARRAHLLTVFPSV